MDGWESKDVPGLPDSQVCALSSAFFFSFSMLSSDWRVRRMKMAKYTELFESEIIYPANVYSAS